MVWTTVKRRLKNLSDRFLNRLLQYENAVEGVRALNSRKYKCSEETMLSMKAATSKLFIDKYFRREKKKAVS